MLSDFVAPEAVQQVITFTKTIETLVVDMVRLTQETTKFGAALGATQNFGQFVANTKQMATANQQMATNMTSFKDVVAGTNSFLNQFSGTMQENIKLSMQYDARLKDIKKAMTEVRDQQKAGIIDTEKASNAIANLIEEEKFLKATLSEVNVAIKAETRERIAAIGSIDEMSARLGRLKDTYRQLGEADRNGAEGNKILTQINALDHAVKEADASIGNFQRNVGNYPNAKKELGEIHQQIAQLILDGKHGSDEFNKLVARGHEVKGAIDKANSAFRGPGDVGGFGGGGTSASAELSQVTQKMHSLVLEGKHGNEEFQQLVARAHELKAAMGEVKMAVDTNTEATSGISDKLSDMASGAVALAATYVSFQGLQQVASDIVEELGQADKNAGELLTTLERYNNVQAFGRLANQADEFAEKFKYLDNDSIIKVFDNLLTYGKLTETQMKELMPVIIDFAAKEGSTVEEASEKIIGALEGNGKALKQYGINIKDAADETEKAASPAERLSLIMKELKPRVEGSAAAFGETLTGKIATLKQGFANLEENIGHFIVSLSGVEEAQQANAVSAKKEADSAQALLVEYEDLSKKVNVTAEDKSRLNTITQELGVSLGQSVIDIDKETGAMTVNIEATKDLIKQKVLLSNQQASTEALKYNKLEEDKIENAKQLAIAQKLYAKAVEETGITEEKVNAKLAHGEMGTSYDRLTDNEKKIAKLSDAVNKYSGQLSNAAFAQDKVAASLAELGFKREDIQKAFNPSAALTPLRDGDEFKGKSGANASLQREFEAEKHLQEERFKFAYESLRIDSEIAQEAMNNLDNSLEDRVEAWVKYYDELDRMAELQKNRDIAIEQAKIRENENKLSLDGKKGGTKLGVADKAAIAKEIEASNIAIAAIEMKFNADRAGIAQKGSDQLVKIQKDEAQKRVDAIKSITTNNDMLEQEELQALVQQLDRKEITYKQYLRQKETLQRVSAKRTSDEVVAYLEEEIAALEKMGIDVKTLVAALNDYKVKAAKTSIADTENKNSRRKNPILAAMGLDEEQWGAVQQIGQEAIQLVDEVVKAIDARYQREIDRIQEVKSAREAAAAADIAVVNKSFMNQKQKDEKIGEIQGKLAYDKKVLDREERELKRKMAVADKAASVTKIIEGTAVAIINAQAIPPPFGQILAGIIAAVGAVQLAQVVATPLPAYKEGIGIRGRGTHPGGYALVGEAGPEVVINAGKTRVVDTPTIMDLSRDARVIPEAKLLENMHLLVGAGAPSYAKASAGESGQRGNGDVVDALKDVQQAIARLPQTKYSQNILGVWGKTVVVGSSKTTVANRKIG